MEKDIFARLERLVRTLAVVIGLTTAVAVPAGFGTVAYWDQIAYRQISGPPGGRTFVGIRPIPKDPSGALASTAWRN